MKPPTTRFGNTHKVKIGKVTAYITVNRNKKDGILEVFGKADEGEQGHLDMACKLISLALQKRGDAATIIRHLRGDRTEPCGLAGQPLSLYDAIGRVMEEEAVEHKEESDGTAEGSVGQG